MWLILAVATLAVSVVAAMMGQGGGALYSPLQVWAGVEFRQAATTSLFLIMAVSLSTSLVFQKAKRIDWLRWPPNWHAGWPSTSAAWRD